MTRETCTVSKEKMKEVASIFNLVRASESSTDAARAIVGSVNTLVIETSEKN